MRVSELLAPVLLAAGCHADLEVLADRPVAASAADSGSGGGEGFRASSVAAGQSHTCAVSGGALYCWGDNSRGALGTGDNENRASPTRVGTQSDWVEVAAGDQATCGRRIDGSVWCWGENSSGEVARADLAPRLEPVDVALPRPAVGVSFRFKTACALADDRTLFCWGENYEGQLGRDDPFVPGSTNPSPTPSQVPLGDDWIAVDTGQGHVCGLRSPADLWCWGRNGAELGLGPDSPVQVRTPTRVGSDSGWLTVSAGQSSTCALRGGGTLWCWGVQGAGLGFDSAADVKTPTQVGDRTGWTAVSINTFGGCALRDGHLWCWGRNAEGQLGLGDTSPRQAPARVGERADWIDIAAGRFHTCARRADGTLWCAGENVDGRLGVADFSRRDELTLVASGEAGAVR